MIQLTPEEGDQYRDCPVVLNFVTGVYMFPVRMHPLEPYRCYSNMFPLA